MDKKENSFENDFTRMLEQDSQITEEEKGELLTSTLGVISKYLIEMEEVQAEAEKLEESLKEKRDRIKTISEVLIPELFDTIQMTSVTLKSGEKVQVMETYAAGIIKKNQEECFKWLKEHKHDGIITHEVRAKFKKGDEKKVKQLLDFVNKSKILVNDKKTVHPQTLKAFVKEQIENEATTKVEFPRDLFSVFTIKQTKVSK